MCIKSTLILEGINWIVNRGGGNKVDYKLHRIWIGCSVNASRYNSNGMVQSEHWVVSIIQEVEEINLCTGCEVSVLLIMQCVNSNRLINSGVNQKKCKLYSCKLNELQDTWCQLDRINNAGCKSNVLYFSNGVNWMACKTYWQDVDYNWCRL